MKKHFYKLVLSTLIISSLIASCGGGGSSTGGSTGNVNVVTLSGTFGGGGNAFMRFMDKFLPTKLYALDPSKVAKVIVFGPAKSEISDKGWGMRYQWTEGKVNLDGTFSVDVDRTAPVGMIFVSYTNAYLGYLSLKDGIAAIPVNLFNTENIPTRKITRSFNVGEVVTGSISGLSGVYVGGTNTVTTLRTLLGREGNWVVGEKLNGERVIIPTAQVSGSFKSGETVTGSISGLTAIYIEGINSDFTVKTVTGNGSWTNEENIVGSESGAVATVKGSSYHLVVAEVTGAATMSSGYLANIDLGVLSSLGNIVEPSRDPLTKEINMTDAELKSLAQVSGMFATVAKNPDADGNGVIDFLEGKNYPMEIDYIFDAGSFGGGVSASISNFRLSNNILVFAPPISFQPANPTVTGPVGSQFEVPAALTSQVGDSDTHRLYYSINPSALLTAGVYTLKGSTGGELSYYIPSQGSVMSDVVVIVPSVVLNGDGTINKITWTYKTPEGNEPVDPTSFMSVIHINMSSNVPVFDCTGKENCDPYGIPTVFANIPSQEINVSNKTIPWDSVTRFTIGYVDKYMNSRSFNYAK